MVGALWALWLGGCGTPSESTPPRQEDPTSPSPTGATGGDTGSADPSEHEVLVVGALSDADPSCLYAVGVIEGGLRTLYCPAPGSDGTPAVLVAGLAQRELNQVPLWVTRTVEDAGGPHARSEVVVVDVETGDATVAWSSDDAGLQWLGVGLVADGQVALLSSDGPGTYELAISSSQQTQVVWRGEDHRASMAVRLGDVLLLAGPELVRFDADGNGHPFDMGPHEAVAVAPLRDRWAVTHWVETGAHENVLLTLVDDQGSALATMPPGWGAYEAAVPIVVERSDGVLVLSLNGSVSTWTVVRGQGSLRTVGRFANPSVAVDQDTVLIVERNAAHTVNAVDFVTPRCEPPVNGAFSGGVWSLTGSHAVVALDRQATRPSLLRCDPDGGLADLSVLTGLTGYLVPWR